jgi:hypothetical protein
VTQHSSPTPQVRAVSGVNLDDSVHERITVPGSRVEEGIVNRTTTRGAPEYGSADQVTTRAGHTTTT